MLGPKIKLSKELADKLKVAAQIAGASSMEEFALQVLDAEAGKLIASTGKREATPDEVAEITKQLHGLGYIE